MSLDHNKAKLGIIRWCKTNGRTPFAKSENKEEKCLAHRCANYCSSAHRSYDPKFKELMCNQFGRQQGNTEEVKKQIIEFYKTHGHPPRKLSKDKEESLLGHKCAHYCAKSSGAYDPEFKELLNKLFDRQDIKMPKLSKSEIKSRIKQITDFIKENRRMPNKNTKEDKEIKLSSYMHSFYSHHRCVYGDLIQIVKKYDKFYGDPNVRSIYRPILNRLEESKGGSMEKEVKRQYWEMVNSKPTSLSNYNIYLKLDPKVSGLKHRYLVKLYGDSTLNCFQKKLMTIVIVGSKGDWYVNDKFILFMFLKGGYVDNPWSTDDYRDLLERKYLVTNGITTQVASRYYGNIKKSNKTSDDSLIMLMFNDIIEMFNESFFKNKTTLKEAIDEYINLIVNVEWEKYEIAKNKYEGIKNMNRKSIDRKTNDNFKNTPCKVSFNTLNGETISSNLGYITLYKKGDLHIASINNIDHTISQLSYGQILQLINDNYPHKIINQSSHI